MKRSTQRRISSPKDNLLHRLQGPGSKWKGPPIVDSIWTPKLNTAFKLLFAFRLTSAVWSNISDCDETYNYWEPAHYLLYGRGFQTWEYSPIYAIRSYAYIALHLLPIKLITMFTNIEKIAVFYILRCILALVCASAETYFYQGVMKQYRACVSRLTLAFLLLSNGMFISASAFLPSSFSMYMTLISMGAWFSGHLPIAIIATAVSTFLGWPFAAIIGLPIAIDILLRKRRVKMFAAWCLAALLVVLLPMVIYDSKMFGKTVIAPLNIVLYNVLTDHGPNIYGTEPWTFYFINGALNFNIVFLMALSAIFVVFVTRFTTGLAFSGIPHWLSMLGMYLWLAIFFLQPHKEERFLFPIYPLFCLNAAITVDSLQKLVALLSGSRHHYSQVLSFVPILLIAVTGLMSVSRGLALHHGYHAPLELYSKLYNVTINKNVHTLPSNRPVHVCVGKEWYRFPSSFFLPTDKWKLKFVRSEFRGQLPAEYATGPDGTKIIPDNMNDMNREEESRYVSDDRCHYMIDLDIGTSSQREPNYSRDESRWEVIHSVPFLDSSRSHTLYRAFYIPFISERGTVYGNYNLLKSRSRRKVQQQHSSIE